MEIENKERDLMGHADINQTRACDRIIKNNPALPDPWN